MATRPRIVRAVSLDEAEDAAPDLTPNAERRIEPFDAVKIASPDLVNYPLLQAAARCGKPLVLSTGAATTDEISTTCRWLGHWNAPFAMLHCVSSYPTDITHANLCVKGRFGFEHVQALDGDPADAGGNGAGPEPAA